MNLTELINHPERLDKETLYELRSITALYPYYQTARLLMLQNLYILHDPTFDEELRRAAVYISDRSVLFQLVEAAHYNIRRAERQKEIVATVQTGDNTSSRTLSLIDSFLDSRHDEQEERQPLQDRPTRRKPTPADATIDYVAYLLETQDEDELSDDASSMKGQTLIDDFIHKESGKIELKDTPEYKPEIDDYSSGDDDNANEYLTETLARIYIKQGRYSKALEIIRRLNLNNPKKSAYFADQIRFLEKLVKNETAS